MSEYTQVRITKEYRDKLAVLAEKEHRSMARQLEVLVDRAITTQNPASYSASTSRLPS